MKLSINQVYEPIFHSKTRYSILMGGRAAGRSTVASQRSVIKFLSPAYYRCAIMRNVFGDIRDSIFREINDRIEELRDQAEEPIDQELNQGLILPHQAEELKKKLPVNLIKVNSSMLNFYYPETKNLIIAKGFKKASSQQTAKLKSLANFTEVIIEEADENDEEDFNQLDDSIRKANSDIQIIMMLNPPPKNHWIIKRWFNLIESGVPGYYIPVLKESAKDEVTFIHTDYRCNIENLNESTIRKYESYKETNPDHYYRMIRGWVAEGQRGRIYTKWQPITNEEFNALPYPSIYGLDFGFSNDPTALVETKRHNNKVWNRLLLYQTGLTNQDIAQRLFALGITDNLIVADSAEPKSIEEIKRFGFNIVPTVKGPDSINAGIQLVQSKENFYTEDSKSLIEELEEYKWLLDANKEPTNKPIDAWNHALDGRRYIDLYLASLEQLAVPEDEFFAAVDLRL